MDFIARLTAMVPPPAGALKTGHARAFANVAAALGLALPDDFKALVRQYGSGLWQVFWYLLDPFSDNDNLNLLKQSSRLRPARWSTLDSERALRDSDSQ